MYSRSHIQQKNYPRGKENLQSISGEEEIAVLANKNIFSMLWK